MAALPFGPPVAPMLARLARELPQDAGSYEPKWDGFRCLAFCSGQDVDLRSRNDRALARYFPELVEALLARLPEPAVLDGEIVVEGFDFAALLARLHPAASRVRQLRERTPAHYIAFDLLALGSADLRGRRFDERRPRLAEVLGDAAPPLHISPSTSDATVARAWLERPAGGGIDGVVVKAADLVYEPGVRAMVKVKHERTVDCVVGGFRLRADKPGVGSLLLGLYDDKDELRHVGVASSFSDRRRRELFDELRGRAAPLDGHPWEQGYLLGGGAAGRLPGAAGRWSAAEMELDWVPLSPQPVCEVAYDHVDVDRFRHPARFRRWRPDRDPGSCRLSQLEGPHLDPFEVLGMT